MNNLKIQKSVLAGWLLTGLMSIGALIIAAPVYAQAETIAAMQAIAPSMAGNSNAAIATSDSSLSPQQAINQLLSDVQNAALSPIVESSLVIKLYGAQTGLERGDFDLFNSKLRLFAEQLQQQNIENKALLIMQVQPIIKAVALQ